MHVLHVTFAYKPADRLGGLIQSVAGLAEGLVRRGHRVTVFATDAGLPADCGLLPDRPVLVDGVEVWYFRRHEPLWAYIPGVRKHGSSGGYMPTPALAPAMRNLIADVDVTHTHAPFSYATRVAGRMVIASGKPLFYSTHGSFNPEMLRKSWLKKLIYISLVERPVMRRAAGLVGLSPLEVENIRRLHLPTPCHQVPNGVDTAQFRRLPRADPIAAYGVSTEQTVILFFGRLNTEKGVELFVDAFLKIANAHPAAVLVIAGPDKDGIARELGDRARQHGHAGRVVVLDFVGGETRLDLLARADLLVLPSRSEGQSMAMLEALASGTPVLISPACDFPIAAERGAGWIVNPDREQLAAALSHLLGHPALLKAAGKRAFELARGQLGWDSAVTKLEEVYATAVRASGGDRVPPTA